MRKSFALALCVMLALVTSGAMQLLHERTEHARSTTVDAQGRQVVAKQKASDTVPINTNSKHPNGTDRQHCPTCATFASLGKMPTAPPVIVAPAPALQSGTTLASYAVPSLRKFHLNAAISQRGPPLG